MCSVVITLNKMCYMYVSKTKLVWKIMCKLSDKMPTHIVKYLDFLGENIHRNSVPLLVNMVSLLGFCCNQWFYCNQCLQKDNFLQSSLMAALKVTHCVPVLFFFSDRQAVFIALLVMAGAIDKNTSEFYESIDDLANGLQVYVIST